MGIKRQKSHRPDLVVWDRFGPKAEQFKVLAVECCGQEQAPEWGGSVKSRQNKMIQSSTVFQSWINAHFLSSCLSTKRVLQSQTGIALTANAIL